jgi:hypothetical protein
MSEPDEAEVASLAEFLSAKRDGRDCTALARRLLAIDAETWRGVAAPTPPAVTGEGEGGEVLGGSDETLLREMARSAQRQLDEWAGPHPDSVGVELPLSVGALRLLTCLPALVAQARADGVAEERERIAAAGRSRRDWALNQHGSFDYRRGYVTGVEDVTRIARGEES